jgi:serine/threonine protein kinase
MGKSANFSSSCDSDRFGSLTRHVSTLSPQLWKEVSPYLDEVLALREEERAAWLENFRDDQPGLAELVKSLLAEHSAAVDEGFLEGKPTRLPSECWSPGQALGAYRLISQIGEGGMGAVWLAKRGDGRFERLVAVKFLQFASAGSGGAERFHREGRFLGQLRDPHIAELIDAGVTPAGAPYLVLEYVEGQQIPQYCDERRLGIEERVRLFLDVLSAVTHAHANLIVHRDIKPSNVMVRNDGEVKLLDFGIAKLIAQEANAAATLLTQAAGPLTPQFAAPEQVTAGTITTATDVYALGVLLHVLLAGQHPAGTQLQSTADLIKAIVDVDPPPMSHAIAGTHAAVAADRSTTPEKLKKQLHGDLDTIVSKALKKNPAERYSSVSAFADDLQRYLKHAPISARPDTLRYRATKFVRRNRTAVTLAATAILLVIGSLSVGLLVADRERDAAERRFAEVRQLANKFIALDNELRGLPGSTQVRMKIVTDSLQYLNSLSKDAPIDQDLALEIAYAYVRVAHAQGDPTSPNLGQFAEAETNLNNAEKFVDPILSKDAKNQRALFIATTIAHDRLNLADSRGDLAAEVTYAGDAAALVERFMATHPITGHDLYSMRYFCTNIAGAYYAGRQFDKVIQYSQRGLDITLPGSRPDALRGAILSNLAAAQWQSGDLQNALKTARESIKFQEAEAASGEPALRINLANAYDLEGMILGRQDAEPSLGRTEEALADFQKALDIAEDLASKDSADYLARHNVTVFALELGNIVRHTDSKQALAIYDHALARIRETKPSASAHRDEAQLLVASSYPLRWVCREQEASQRLDRAFVLLQTAQRFPAEKVEPLSDTYMALRGQADDYVETGRSAQAIDAYRKLLDKVMAWGPNVQNDLRDAICVARTWTALADLLRRTGQRQEAESLQAKRADLWNHWSGKPLNAQALLRQSLSQVAPPKASSLCPPSN